MAAGVGLRLAGRFLGNAVSESFAFAAGVAIGPVLGPPVQELRNSVNAAYPYVPVDPGTAAGIVAEDVELRDWGASEAAAHGVNGARFDAILGEALNAPGVPELLALHRRGLIDTAGFVHGLRKAKLEGQWDAPLEGLLQVLLAPAELANARQQGYIDQARQYDEAALQGIDNERAEIQFEMVGLPPGHAEAQQMLNRGLIDQATFAQMIREGHTKTKYTDVLQRNARHWLTPIEWVDAHLRGHATQAEMYAGTAAWGVTKADTDVLFTSHGRALSTKQITTGLARGGVFNGPTDHIPDVYLASLKQGSIQPPYYNIDYANRYTLPSFFVLRALIQDGTLTEQQGAEYFKQEGWPPALADAAAAAYSGGTTAKADSHLGKAQTQLWTTTHSSYRANEITTAAATQALQRAGVDAAAIPGVLAIWDEERALIRARLSAADARKAYQKQDVNPATNAVWTRAEAVAQLISLGWSNADAEAYLNIG